MANDRSRKPKEKKSCSHDDFLKFNFSHFTQQVIIFFVEKRQPKILGFKM